MAPLSSLNLLTQGKAELSHFVKGHVLGSLGELGARQDRPFLD